MSVTQAMNAPRAAQAHDDLWLVRLRGKVRAMTLDELDAAFQAGLINQLTPVLPPTAKAWTQLGIVAGLDDAAPETTLVGYSETVIMPSSRPRPVLKLLVPTAPVTQPTVAPPVKPPAARRKPSVRSAPPRTMTSRTFAALALGVLVLSFGISSAARYAFGRTVQPETDSVPAAEVVASATDAVTAPPGVAAVVGEDDDSPNLAPRSEHRVGAEGSSVVRDAQVRKDGRARRHHVHVRRPTGRTPFINGGDKYDPLNGAL